MVGDNCYKVVRDDGKELGTFDRSDEAQRVAQDDAATRNYSLRWTTWQGGRAGIPSTSGRGVHRYTITDVPCQ